MTPVFLLRWPQRLSLRLGSSELVTLTITFTHPGELGCRLDPSPAALSVACCLQSALNINVPLGQRCLPSCSFV